jgi:hypothetical protein
MPVYTKSALMTWTTSWAKYDNVELANSRNAYIQSMVDQQKTDGVPYNLDDLQTKRIWTDQAAAEAWSAFITDLAANTNQGLVSVVITDNV